MSNQNVEVIEKIYDAFGAGDLETVLSVFHESAEWKVHGESRIGGTYRGKGGLFELFMRLGEKFTQVKPDRFYADGNVVVVLSQVTAAGIAYDSADVYTFIGDRVIKAESFGDTAKQERIFGANLFGKKRATA